MRISARQQGAALSLAVSVLAGLVFFAAASIGGQGWVARTGGALWVFLLVLIILLPTLMPWLRERAGARGSATPPHQEDAHNEHAHTGTEAVMAKDPVCGMDVDPAAAAGMSEYKGRAYYFCAPGCKRAFDGDPGKYAALQ
jgi:Cu+-exporting ATPase